jgi:hypothetical protein
LGGAIGKLGLAMHLSDIEEEQKTQALLGFVATVGALTDPILEKIEDSKLSLEMPDC